MVFSVRTRLKESNKKKLKNDIIERKGKTPLPVYFFWFVFRTEMVMLVSGRSTSKPSNRTRKTYSSKRQVTFIEYACASVNANEITLIRKLNPSQN